jgi:hypothetical protein
MACSPPLAGGNHVLSIGQTISHHSVVSKLGKGGMSEVYGAKALKIERDVASRSCPRSLREPNRVASNR